MGQLSPLHERPQPQPGRTRLVALVVVALLATTVTPTPALGADGSSDVSSGGMHEPAIGALADQGIFTNTECGDGLFCPDEPINRWVMAVWLIRVLGGETDTTGTSRFGEVIASEWWSPTPRNSPTVGSPLDAQPTRSSTAPTTPSPAPR